MSVSISISGIASAEAVGNPTITCGPPPQPPSTNGSGDLYLADLTHFSMWVGWREELQDGRKTKVPYDPCTGAKAESTRAPTFLRRIQEGKK
jgi:hypothetical protein